MSANIVKLELTNRPAPQLRLEDRINVSSEADIVPAAQALVRKVREFGLRIMVWHDLASSSPLNAPGGNSINQAVFGWNDEELAPWFNSDWDLRSPIMRAARMCNEPFRINSDGIRMRETNQLDGTFEFGDLADHPHPRSAIVVPVHMAFGQVGAGVLSGERPTEEHLATTFSNLNDDLVSAIRRFLIGASAVQHDRRYLPEDCVLSRREVECLTWISYGKTDYEIAIILGCSHAAIRYHITRACKKLGATNRSQSVFRACQLGYLSSQFCRSN